MWSIESYLISFGGFYCDWLTNGNSNWNWRVFYTHPLILKTDIHVPEAQADQILSSMSLLKSRPYFCHEQAPVLGTFSFLYYFQQKISQPLHHGAPWNWTQSEGETKSSQNDSTHSEALSSLGLPGVHCHQRGFGDIFQLLAKAAWPAPLRAPFTRAPRGRPSCARSARWSTARSPRLQGPWSGRNDQWNFEFCFHFQFDFKELHDEVLEIFFAGNSKENCKSLKPVSVHDRNKA